MTNYKNKYLKYKLKYLKLKGGGICKVCKKKMEDLGIDITSYTPPDNWGNFRTCPYANPNNSKPNRHLPINFLDEIDEKSEELLLSRSNSTAINNQNQLSLPCCELKENKDICPEELPEKCRLCGNFHIIKSNSTCPGIGYTLRPIKTKNEKTRPMIEVLQPFLTFEEPLAIEELPNRDEFNSQEDYDKFILSYYESLMSLIYDIPMAPMQEKHTIKPVIQWVGGKRRLIPIIMNNLPPKFNDYYEPFLGGASVFLEMPWKQNATINDFSIDLVSMYVCIKYAPDYLIENLNTMQNEYNSLPGLIEKRLYFDNIKKLFNKTIKGDNTDIENHLINPFEFSMFTNVSNVPTKIYHPYIVVLYIFINKACFNAIMKYNKNGELSSGFGKKEKLNLFNMQNIINFNTLLNSNVIITHGDYRDSTQTAKPGDFVYLDPPYIEYEPDDETVPDYEAIREEWEKRNVPGHFYSYVPSIVEDDSEGWSHRNLLNAFDELNERDVNVMMSNANRKMLRDWAESKGYRYIILPIIRTVSGKRRYQEEIIIMNYW